MSPHPVIPVAPREERLEAAARALVAKLDAILPIVDGMIALQFARNKTQYTGPNLVAEMAELRELLASAPVPCAPPADVARSPRMEFELALGRGLYLAALSPECVRAIRNSLPVDESAPLAVALDPHRLLTVEEIDFLLAHTKQLLENQHSGDERVETCDAPSCVKFRDIRARLRGGRKHLWFDEPPSPDAPIVSAIQALIQQWQKEAQARETEAVATQRDKWKAVNFYRALAVTDCASQLAALCPTPKRPLCVCGHDVHFHEDAEGGTHECWYPGCACQQFAEVCPAPPEET